MKKYAICKICGYSMENIESGNYYCPQCKKEVQFYRLELFDGSKPGKIYEKDN
jgi:rubrerythrin